MSCVSARGKGSHEETVAEADTLFSLALWAGEREIWGVTSNAAIATNRLRGGLWLHAATLSTGI
jgi:hypothetical protein